MLYGILNFDSGHGLLLVTEPVLTFFQLDPWEQILVKFEPKYIFVKKCFMLNTRYGMTELMLATIHVNIWHELNIQPTSKNLKNEILSVIPGGLNLTSFKTSWEKIFVCKFQEICFIMFQINNKSELV